MADNVKEFMIKNIKHPTSWAIQHKLNPKIITNRIAGKNISAQKAIMLKDIFLVEYATLFSVEAIAIPGYQGLTGGRRPE